MSQHEEKELYRQQFEEAFAALNQEQKKAVQQIDGPVLVVAGPGTGKTHILATRIGRILLETDTQSYNILCLTFTDAGAIAMRDRLLQIIGLEAHNVHIFTFHSFCNKIIQENLELFGIQQLEPLNDLERVEIIRKMIDELPIDNPLKRGRRDIYFYEKHLHHLFSMMKREHWTPELMYERIRQYLQEFPNRPENTYQRKTGRFQKGDKKEGKIRKENEKMERLWAAVGLFEEYKRQLRLHRRYDYDDMLLWVIREFGRYEKLLRFYQEQYLYILVDEYQDTNGAQNDLLRLLIQYWDNPNVFIVGDDDQSIYEFQGARLKNIVDFHQQYQPYLTTIFLKNNYRSTPAILEIAQSLIDFNKKRISESLGVEKKLVAQHPEFKNASLRPTITVYPNRMHEDSAILTQIEHYHQQGIAYEEMAVIYARHRQARQLIALLEKRGIPYHTKRKVNVLDLPMVENLRFILEYINLEYHHIYSGEHLLFQLLHFDFLNLPADEVEQISRHLANKIELKWRDVLLNQSLLEEIGLANAEKVTRFAELLQYLIRQYRNLSLPVLVEQLINRSGLLRHVLAQPNEAWGLQVLATLTNFIRTEVDRKPRLRLDGLLEVLKKMDANYLTVSVEKTEQVVSGVNFVTAHSSKGLEFRVVFILDATTSPWEPGRKAPFTFALPDTLTYSGEEDELEARRRLFYVAMTRAKEYLHLSYAEQDNRGKPRQRTRFVDEILAKSTLKVNSVNVVKANLITAYQTLLTETKAPRIEPIKKAVADELLKDFRLSISSLNTYLRCPLSFYYEKVLRVPTINSTAAAYGTAAHYALMMIFEKMRRSKGKRFPALKQFLGYFGHEMKRQRSVFTQKEYDRRLELGRANLTTIYQQNIQQWHKDIKVELPIKNVTFANVPLTGVIDRVNIHKDFVHLVDYKTGSHKRSKLARPTDKNPQGGTYWRQLVFYKVLYESYGRHRLKADSGEIFYIDPDPAGNFTKEKINISLDDRKVVEQLIIETYAHIQQHNFYEGCGESNCQWCNFVLKNQVVTSFADPQLEELDDRL